MGLLRVESHLLPRILYELVLFFSRESAKFTWKILNTKSGRLSKDSASQNTGLKT